MKPSTTNKQHLIIMVGIPGAGKSYFADKFADTFKSPLINTSSLRYKLSDTPSFSKDEDRLVSKLAEHILDETLKTGCTIIFEGLTDTKLERLAISKKARSAGYEPLFVWVQTEPITAKKRSLKSTDGKKTLNLDQFNERVKRFNAPTVSEKAVVISGKHPYANQLKIVLKNLATKSDNNQNIPQQDKQIRTPRTRNFLIR